MSCRVVNWRAGDAPVMHAPTPCPDPDLDPSRTIWQPLVAQIPAKVIVQEFPKYADGGLLENTDSEAGDRRRLRSSERTFGMSVPDEPDGGSELWGR